MARRRIAATAQVMPGPNISAPTRGSAGRWSASIATPILRGGAQNARRICLTRGAARSCRCLAVVGRAFARLPARTARGRLPAGGAAARLVVAGLPVASGQKACKNRERDRAEYAESHVDLLLRI